MASAPLLLRRCVAGAADGGDGGDVPPLGKRLGQLGSPL